MEAAQANGHKGIDGNGDCTGLHPSHARSSGRV